MRGSNASAARSQLREGRAELEAYWRPRLDALAPTAFGLEEITPTADGVVLDYLGHEGKPVRIAFTFTPTARSGRPLAPLLRGAAHQELPARSIKA